jgi:D-3-phosphoglycerate dehydrogenase
MKVAVLDDYQRVARRLGNWGPVEAMVELVVFDAPFADRAQAVAVLADFEVICLMRERLPFPRAMFEALPKLKCLITTGQINRAIDLEAARDHDVTVRFTGDGPGYKATAELTWGLIIACARQLALEDRAIRQGRWQTTLGSNLGGRVLGVVGLGRIGQHVARIAKAFDMKVIAWSPNLTAERTTPHEVGFATKADLFRNSDFITLHMPLTPATRGLITAPDLQLMKPTAYFINTARGPIVDETALIDVLSRGVIAGAGLDVFDQEPLPRDHALRGLENVVLSPHLGYVTEDVYRVFYADTARLALEFLQGK